MPLDLFQVGVSNSYDLQQKLSGCSGCPYAGIGRGFCPDFLPDKPRLAFLARDPDQADIVEKLPFSGAAGRLLVHWFIERNGYTRADVLLANLLHCHVPLGYPVFPLRQQAEKHCRQYWGALDKFDPNIIVLTYDPEFVIRNWSSMRVVSNDVAKAFRLAQDPAKRVLVIMGDVVKERLLPSIPAGISKWRGHWQPINWKEISK